MSGSGGMRRFDGLGRIVIPKELRDAAGWGPESPVEFLATDEGVLVRSWSGGCVFCGEGTTEADVLLGRPVCGECRAALKDGA